MPNNDKLLKGHAPRHRWTFFRVGGFDQVRLQTGADIMALEQLDQKLWMSLSCPTHGLEFDSRTLELIDTDGDGRIRVREILDAVQWAGNCLKDPDILTKNLPELSLSEINDATPEGKNLLNAAREILAILGKPDSPVITTDDTANTEAIFTQTTFNGDGIVPVGSADDPAVQIVISDIIQCLGGETDRNGNPGVTQEKVDHFFSEIQAYHDWWRRQDGDPLILPLGQDTAAAVTAFRAVKDKIDDYFARCRLAAFDERSVLALNRQETDYAAFADSTLSRDAAAASGFPLARISADTPLPLSSGLNPAWSLPIATFVRNVVTPFLGKKKPRSRTPSGQLSSSAFSPTRRGTRQRPEQRSNSLD